MKVVSNCVLLLEVNMDVKDYLKLIVAPILRHPDVLTVVYSKDDMGILLTIDVHKDDMGLIVGKGGETAKAIRHLVRIVGIIANARVSIKINEPEGSTYKRKI